MIELNDVSRILDRITYKPGWLFNVYDKEYLGGLWPDQIVVLIQVIKPTVERDIGTYSAAVPVALLATKDFEPAFLRWFEENIAEVEKQMAQEYLKIDNKKFAAYLLENFISEPS